MNTQMYLIRCLTNLHAGTGAADQGIIDNLVQRDHVDQVPCIYASSLKGAFREYFEEYLEKQNKVVKGVADSVFGGKNGNKSRGSHIFYDAILFSIPVRSNKSLFYRATSPGRIARILEMCDKFGKNDGIEDKLRAFHEKYTSSQVCLFNFEEIEQQKLRFEFLEGDYKNESDESLCDLLGKKFIVLPDADFEILVSDYCLPVIARNQLESGISNNLFYEQVMPRQTQFIFWTSLFPDCSGISDEFRDVWEKTDLLPVQIGANASIGYGYCTVKPLLEQDYE